MKLRGRSVSVIVLLLCAIASSATVALAQRDQQRDPLGFLKRVITEAGAPALTSQQETQLNDLINNFRQGQPDSPDQALQAARTAYHSAILAGDLAAAQAQAQIIANRTAEHASARLQAEAKFDTDVLAVLKSGGQLEALRQKLSDDRLLGLISSLAGPPFGGGRPGFGPGFGPGPRREGFGRNQPGDGR
jgi:Spy/CpxP family protein refolding chaperone